MVRREKPLFAVNATCPPIIVGFFDDLDYIAWAEGEIILILYITQGDKHAV